MLIQLTDSLNHEQELRKYEGVLEFDRFRSGRSVYAVQNVSAFTVSVRKLGAKDLRIETELSLELLMPCDRCLEDVVVPFSLSVDREVSYAEQEREEEKEEHPYIDGYTLDVDALIRDELFVNLPMKVLCSENCKGLCNRCGVNLNHETCSCDTTELDPRMARIRDIFYGANQ